MYFVTDGKLKVDVCEFNNKRKTSVDLTHKNTAYLQIFRFPIAKISQYVW